MRGRDYSNYGSGLKSATGAYRGLTEAAALLGMKVAKLPPHELGLPEQTRFLVEKEPFAAVFVRRRIMQVRKSDTQLARIARLRKKRIKEEAAG